MQTVTFKAPEHLYERLEALAGKLDRNKSYLLRKAVEQYLEDEEDYMLALGRLAEDRPETRLTLDALKRRHGLDG